MAKLRVFLADDHAVVREGLKALVNAQPTMAVVGEAADGLTACAQVALLAPDVVVMDVSMPGLSGSQATARLRLECPAVRVLALTVHEDRGYLRQLLAAGAAGYVLKRAAPEELIQAIRAVAAKGGVMGITGVRNFVTRTEPTTVANIVDHIDHVVKLTGIEHVGIGTDADLNGYDDVSPEMNKRLRGAYKDSYAFREKIDVDGFDHPMKMFDLTEELIRRRYSDANISAILGGNFQRLLTSTWGG